MKWARLAWQRALRVKTCSVPETGAKRFLAQVTTSGDAEMLRVAEIARYQENGQLTPSFRLSAETIARIERKMEALFAAHPELDPDYAPSLIELDKSWLEIASMPEILDAVGQLIGHDIVVWGSAFFCKRGTGGKATPWHQDGQYWPMRPLESCTVWIAIDHSTPENGCLRIIPGSHKQREMLDHDDAARSDVVLNQAVATEAMPEVEPIDVVLEPGQLSIHDAFIVHGAEPNNSGQRRGGLTFRYMPTTSHFDRDLARRQAQELGVIDISDRDLHLVRGVDRCGKNDIYQAAAGEA